jgi:uncharacterized membrane protein YhhN
MASVRTTASWRPDETLLLVVGSVALFQLLDRLGLLRVLYSLLSLTEDVRWIEPT